MKVSVCAQITYTYEVELDNGFEDSDVIYCDSADPVYREICKLMEKHHLNFEGRIESIIDDDTDEVVYVGE